MGCRKALLLASNTTGVDPLALYAVAFVPAFVNIASVALCSVLLLKGNVTPKLIKRLTRNPRIAFLVLEAAARLALVVRVYGGDGGEAALFDELNGQLLTATIIIEAAYLLLALVLFIILDCCKVPVPRTRCALGLNLLLLLFVSAARRSWRVLPLEQDPLAVTVAAFEYVSSRPIQSIILSVDLGISLLLVGRICETLLRPSKLAFLTHPLTAAEYLLHLELLKRRKGASRWRALQYGHLHEHFAAARASCATWSAAPPRRCSLRRRRRDIVARRVGTIGAIESSRTGTPSAVSGKRTGTGSGTATPTSSFGTGVRRPLKTLVSFTRRRSSTYL